MDFDVLIEIPAQGSVKYEIDEESGKLRVDRFLHTAMVYPFNYGYIEGSMGEDGDPLDVVVLSSHSVQGNVVIKCHAIGLLEMEDEAGIDTKIIVVPDKKIDPVYGLMIKIEEVPEIVRLKIKHFFDHMKELEPGKWVKTGNYKSVEKAEKEVNKALRK